MENVPIRDVRSDLLIRLSRVRANFHRIDRARPIAAAGMFCALWGLVETGKITTMEDLKQLLHFLMLFGQLPLEVRKNLPDMTEELTLVITHIYAVYMAVGINCIPIGALFEGRRDPELEKDIRDAAIWLNRKLP